MRLPTILAACALVAGCRTERRADDVLVLVSNEDSGDVTIVDSARDEVTATIHVGKRPRGLRVSPDGRWLYVALSGTPKRPPQARAAEPIVLRTEPEGDGIAVVDLLRRTLVRTLPAGSDPESFDVTPDGKRLYVSNEDSGEVSVVDVPGAKVLRSIRVGDEPEGVTISPDGRFAYVASEGSSEVHVIATATDEIVAHAKTAARPRAIAFSPDGSRAFVTTENGGALHVFDTSSHSSVAQIRTGPVGARPMGVAVAPDGLSAWVGNGREGSVAQIDLASHEVIRRVAAGTRPWGVALGPGGKKLYVATGDDLVIVDTASGVINKRLPTKGSWGVAVARKAAR